MTTKIIYQKGQKLRDDSLLRFQYDTNHRPRKAVFICDCGNSKEICIAGVKNGTTLSCGCLHSKMVSDAFKTHGMTDTKINYIWRGMKARCSNKNNKSYKDYGARGITVCHEWMKFENFYADMGDKPEGMSLDRIDNDKGYSKANCKWSTRTEQNRNSRSNNNLTFDGKTQCISAWADEIGIEYHALYQRIHRGWSTCRALTE